MATITRQSLSTVRKLYSTGYSAREIAERLRVSIDAVYYFLRQQKIARRSPTEQNAMRFAKKEPSFIVNETLSLLDQKLLIAGVMLYWGEGAQWDGGKTVDFANSRPEAVKVFLQFLRVICGVNEKRLRCYLYCYSNQDVGYLVKFWSNLLKIPSKQFTKPYIRSDYDPSKINKMPHGLIHVRYSDKKLLILLRQWIKELPKQFE